MRQPLQGSAKLRLAQAHRFIRHRLGASRVAHRERALDQAAPQRSPARIEMDPIDQNRQRLPAAAPGAEHLSELLVDLGIAGVEGERAATGLLRLRKPPFAVVLA